MLPLLRRRGTQLPLERSVRGVAPACGMPLHPPVVHVGIVVHDGDDDVSPHTARLHEQK